VALDDNRCGGRWGGRVDIGSVDVARLAVGRHEVESLLLQVVGGEKVAGGVGRVVGVGDDDRDVVGSLDRRVPDAQTCQRSAGSADG